MLVCKLCGEQVFAIDLMPRILAITGTPDDFDWAPEQRDEDIYEASETIGFGCETESCVNWIGNLGNLSKANHGEEWWTMGSKDLPEIAVEESSPEIEYDSGGGPYSQPEKNL